NWTWITCPKRAQQPLTDAITVFTDAGKKSRTAAITWQDEKGQWQKHLIKASPEDTLQTLELLAVVWAMLHVTEPLNIVTDSLYVVGVCERIEAAYIK
ncbi:POK6 protein, partial [Donacobius atricapilla]|nr:POK6 protein [Donacobius atricapilla]